MRPNVCATLAATSTCPALFPCSNRQLCRQWLDRLKATEASVLNGIDRYPLMIGLFGLALLLGALSLTWYREGR